MVVNQQAEAMDDSLLTNGHTQHQSYHQYDGTTTQQADGDLVAQFDGETKLEDLTCVRCADGFGLNEQIVNSGGQVWHAECFVCAQCFQPFPDGIYFEFEGR